MSHEAIALWTETSSDPELIAGVRAGDTAAFGVLYERHVDAARKVASMYTNAASDIDDVVSESFSRVLRALQRGDGPDLAFRAYLFTIVRRTGLDIINKGIRTKPREDMSEYESEMGFGAASDEPTLDGFEHGMVAEAFRSLPERWQAVLWYTEVEKKSPREVAPLLGLSANGVAALSYRAREALRQAYLQQHLNTSEQVSCLEANAQLGAYVRGGLSKREAVRVSDHIDVCERCSALVAELEDVNRGMRGVIAPIVLGTAGMAALEGGLPIGGALGLGEGAGAASAVGAGVTTASGVVGTAGLTATGFTTAGVAATAGTAASAGGGLSALIAGASGMVVPVTAVVGVLALAVAGAGYLGFFSDPPAPDPLAIDSPVVETTPPDPGGGSGDGQGGSDGLEPAVTPSPTPSASEPAEPAPGTTNPPSVRPPSTQQPGTGGTGNDPSTAPTTDPKPAPTTDPKPTPTTDPDPDPTTDPTPEPTKDPDPEPTKEPDPDPTKDPDPDPTTDPDPGTGPRPFALSISEAPLGYLEISRTSPQVPLKVTNSGDQESDPVTAEISLPDGLQFASPAGGSGATSRQSDKLSAYMNFALSGTVTVDSWTCTLDDSMTEASCSTPAVDAKTQASLALDLEVTVGATESLAPDAVTSFVVTSGGNEVSYSVRTGLVAAEENFDDVFTGTGRLATAHFGAPLMGCQVGSASEEDTCRGIMNFAGNGSEARYNNNAWAMVPLNEAGGVRNSATTAVTIPAGAVVKYAAIEWAANYSPLDVGFDGPTNVARLRVPGADYVDITAESVTTTTDVSNRTYYQARADITDLVIAAGAGDYSLADVAQAITRNQVNDRNYLSGFAITIVYEHPSLPESMVTFFDGSEWVTSSVHPDFTFYTETGATVTLGFVAWDGDRGTVGDRVELGPVTGGGQTLQPIGGWNGNTTTGAGDSGNAASSTAIGSKHANTLGTDAKLFVPAHVNSGLHVLRFTGMGDNYLLGTFTVTIALDD